MDMHTPLDGARNSRLGLLRLWGFKIELKNVVAHFQNSGGKKLEKKYFDARMLAGEN